MLAENEWRLHGNDEAGGGQQWHMPRQTLDMVRQPSFCRGVQNLFLDAIEGDGTALLSADMLYPDHSMRESANAFKQGHNPWLLHNRDPLSAEVRGTSENGKTKNVCVSNALI